MKKILCLVLAAIIAISMVACGKNSEQKNEPTQPKKEQVSTEPTMPVEDGDKDESKYEGELLTATGLIQRMESDSEEQVQISDLLPTINGRIQDIYSFDNSLYVLTGGGLYQFHGYGTCATVVDIKANDHCGIYAITNQFIVLIRNDGKYDVWGVQPYTRKYVECEFNHYVTNDITYLSVHYDSAGVIGGIYIIHNVDADGFDASVYEFENEYTENAKFVLKDEKKHFDISIGKSLKYFCTAKVSDTQGLAVMENGDLYLAEMHFAESWAEREFYIHKPTQPFKDVERVFSTNQSKVFLAIKNNDTKNLYEYTIVYDSEQHHYVAKEQAIKMPESINIRDIGEIVYSGNQNKYYALIGEQWYLLDTMAAQPDAPMIMGQYESRVASLEIDDFYTQIEANLYAIVPSLGQIIYLMDDHHLYIQPW